MPYITIQVNGESKSVKANLSLAELLQQWRYQDANIAVEVNQRICPRSQWQSTPIDAADRIEIITAVGGG